MAWVTRELMACFFCKCMLPTSITELKYLNHLKVISSHLILLLKTKHATTSRSSTGMYPRLMWGKPSSISSRARS